MKPKGIVSPDKPRRRHVPPGLGFFIVLSILPAAARPMWAAEQPLTMKRAVQLALAGNPDLIARRLDIDLAQCGRTSASVRPNPEIQFQYAAVTDPTRRSPGSGTFGGDNTQYAIGIGLPLTTAGKRRAAIRAAEIDIAAARGRSADAASETAFTVCGKWLDIWYLTVSLDLLEQARAAIADLVQTDRVRLKNEVITPTDLLRSQILQEQYELQIKSLRQEYENESRNLRVLIGSTATQVIDRDDPVMALVPAERLEELLTCALAHREDYRLAQTEIDAARADLGVQRALAVPDLQLSVQWSRQNNVPYLQAGIGWELPWRDRNQGNIARARLRARQAEQERSALEQRIRGEVENTLRTYQECRRNLAGYQAIIAMAEKALETVRYSYLHGNTTLIDFLEAQRTWLDTRKLYFDALFALRRSHIALLHATNQLKEIAS